MQQGRTGLYKHFLDGCPNDTGQDIIRITLVDFFDTSENKLRQAGHEPGPQCRCVECNGLKRVEDKWILRMGTFHGASGLNRRDELTAVARGNYRK